MIKIKKVLATALLGVLAFSIVGCEMIQKTPEAIQKTVIAKVGNEKITKADMDKLIEPYLQQFESQYGADYATNTQVVEQLKALKTQALDVLIEQKVVELKAKELNLLPTQEEIDAKVKEYIDAQKEQFGGQEAFTTALEQAKMTEEEYTESVKENMKAQLTSEKVAEEIFKDINISDEDVKAYYEENKANYGEANVSHILIADEEKAKEVRERAANGEDFAALAKEFSEDPGSKDKGGNYGVLPYNSTTYVKEFVDGYKTLKEGEISQPVKSEFGYHIIKATDVKVKSFDDVKAEIKTELENTKKNEVYTENMDKWKAEYKIKKYEDKL